MKNTPKNKEKAIKYIYGDLLRAERDAYEEQLFTDETAGFFIEDVENDLIDEYVRGELGFERKREFEKKYLTTESRHERVALARTLQNEFFEERRETVIAKDEKAGIFQRLAGLLKVPNLALAGGLATILLLALIGGVWLTSQSGGNENIASGGNNDNNENIKPIRQNTPTEVSPIPEEKSSENLKVEENKTVADKSNANLNKKESVEKKKPKLNKVEKTPTPKPIKKAPRSTSKKPKTVQPKKTIFAFSLFPPLRSGQNPILKIPATAKTVRLQLIDDYGQKYNKFIIELNDSTGNTIWSNEVKASEKRPQKSIGISISEKSLKQGTYEIAVSGITEEGSVEEINYYNFVVQRK